MKKILAIAIIAVMTVVLCISASARYSLDRLYVNYNDRLVAEGEGQSSANPAEAAYTIQAGDKIYIIGWAVSDAGLDKIVYTVNGGSNIACVGGYRDRPDVANAFSLPAEAGVGAGFGFDKAEDGGMLELTGIDRLKAGTYEIVIKALFKDGSEEIFDTTTGGGLGVFTLTVEGEIQGEEPSEPSPTSDAAIIAIAAVGCVALAGVVVAKKAK